MADEELTEAEVEALLAAMEPEPVPTAPQKAPPVAAKLPARPRSSHAAPVAAHKPRLDKQQLRALAGVHEAFARALSTSLGTLLRWNVEVKLASVGEVAFTELKSTFDDPTCLHVLRSATLDATLVLETPPALAFPMVDRLLGGGREPMVVARRPLTQIEQRLIARVTALVLHDLCAAWKPVIDMDLAVERVESSAHAIDVVPASASSVLARFDVAMRGMHSSMKLCILPAALLRIGDALASPRTPGDAPSPTSPGPSAAPKVTLVAELAEATVTATEMANLSVGDVITTDVDSHGPILIRIDGVQKFRAQPGSSQGQRAVQIVEVVERHE